MIPRPAHHLEPPDLVRGPTIRLALNIALHEVALGRNPARLQPSVVVDLAELAPARLAAQLAEDAVFVVAPGPVEGAELGRAAYAAGGSPERGGGRG